MLSQRSRNGSCGLAAWLASPSQSISRIFENSCRAGCNFASPLGNILSFKSTHRFEYPFAIDLFYSNLTGSKRNHRSGPCNHPLQLRASVELVERAIALPHPWHLLDNFLPIKRPPQRLLASISGELDYRFATLASSSTNFCFRADWSFPSSASAS